MSQNPMTRDEILKYLQYEGKENDPILLTEIQLGQQILDLILKSETDPSTAIITLTSILGFLIMSYAKSEESRKRVVMITCLSLMKNCNVQKSDIEERFNELKNSGVFKED